MRFGKIVFFLGFLILGLQSVFADDCRCNPCECNPCECKTQERQGTQERYSQAFNQLEGDWNVFFSLDFLYWYAKETGLPYAMKVQNNADNIVPVSMQYNDASWDPGFRIGIGYNIPHDGWDLYLHWTYFHNKTFESSSVASFTSTTGQTPLAGEEALLDPWHNPTLRDVTGQDFFSRVSGKWDLNLNIIDLELGRKFWISKYLALRPYSALRGAWNKSRFHVNATLPLTNHDEAIILSKQDFTRNFWGVGFLAGMQPDWHFTKNWSIYGNVDFALLWGRFDLNEKRKQPVVPAINDELRSSFDNDFYAMQAIIDMAMGFKWERTYQNRYHIAFSLGWEHHIWFDHNHRTKLLGFKQDLEGEGVKEFTNFDTAYGNLVFAGLVLRGKFDF